MLRFVSRKKNWLLRELHLKRSICLSFVAFIFLLVSKHLCTVSLPTPVPVSVWICLPMLCLCSLFLLLGRHFVSSLPFASQRAQSMHIAPVTATDGVRVPENAPVCAWCLVYAVLIAAPESMFIYGSLYHLAPSHIRTYTRSPHGGTFSRTIAHTRSVFPPHRYPIGSVLRHAFPPSAFPVRFRFSAHA